MDRLEDDKEVFGKRMYCESCKCRRDGKFCLECGTKTIDVETCSSCDEQLTSGHMYCGKCGKKCVPGDTKEKSSVEQAGPSGVSSHRDLQTDKRVNTAINFLKRKYSKGDTNVEDGKKVVDLTKDDGRKEVKGAKGRNDIAEDKVEEDDNEEELPEIPSLRKVKDVDVSEEEDEDGEGGIHASPALRKVTGERALNDYEEDDEESLPEIANLRKRRRENIVEDREDLEADITVEDQDDEMEDSSLEMQLYIQRQNRLQERKVMAMERLQQKSCEEGENVVVVFYENRQRKGYCIQITQNDTVQDLFDKICSCISPEELAPKFFLQTDEGEKVDLFWRGSVKSLAKVKLIEEEYLGNETITNMEEVVFDV
ncbi:glutamic acid-rich protein-like [Ruditapes philippinarum]|uniref:glutamic acid-rich protein-like n=1 Tax=Ruditapes philippinarum TaxID=129788 RepID=UPI00295C392C|nr:glutamic acid-rich protein-like [Ruditapes philippinarum]